MWLVEEWEALFRTTVAILETKLPPLVLKLYRSRWSAHHGKAWKSWAAKGVNKTRRILLKRYTLRLLITRLRILMHLWLKKKLYHCLRHTSWPGSRMMLLILLFGVGNVKCFSIFSIIADKLVACAAIVPLISRAFFILLPLLLLLLLLSFRHRLRWMNFCK